MNNDKLSMLNCQFLMLDLYINQKMETCFAEGCIMRILATEGMHVFYFVLIVLKYNIFRRKKFMYLLYILSKKHISYMK